jgi:hypothetical protein
MADPNNLKIKITAVDLTKRVFRGLSKSLSFAKNALLNFKTSLIAVAGVGGLGLLIRSSMQSIDVLGKTATKIGVTTQALQKLRFAADLVGVEARTVDMALQRFTRRLSEAANNTGEAKDALKELGITASSFQDLSLEDQMLKLSDAFKSVDGESEKVRLAFKLFDSEGVAMVNILRQGSGALREMFNEADSLGIVLSTGAVRGVEAANDEITRLFSLFRGLTNTMVSALAPAIGGMVEEFRKFIQLKIGDNFDDIEAAAREMVLSIIEFLKNASIAFVEFGNNVIDSINTMRRGLFNLKKVFSNSIDEKEFQQKIDKAVQHLDFFASMADEKGGKYAEALQKALDATEPLRDGTAKTKDEFIKIRDALQDVLDEFGGYASGVKTSIFAVQGLADASGNLKQSFVPLGRITLETGGFFDFLSDKVKETKKETDGLTESVKACSGAIVDLDEIFEPATTGLKDYAEQARRVKQNLRTAALNGVKSFEDALVGVIDGTMKAKDAFKKMAQSIISDLIRMQVQRSITGPISSALNALLPQGESVAKAMGGHVAANRPYIVGERGPELMIPGASGTIIPNNKMGGNGTVVNQTINVSTGVSQTVRAEIMQLMPQISENTKAAVLDARRRGGSFASAF